MPLEHLGQFRTNGATLLAYFVTLQTGRFLEQLRAALAGTARQIVRQTGEVIDRPTLDEGTGDSQRIGRHAWIGEPRIQVFHHHHHPEHAHPVIGERTNIGIGAGFGGGGEGEQILFSGSHHPCRLQHFRCLGHILSPLRVHGRRQLGRLLRDRPQHAWPRDDEIVRHQIDVPQHKLHGPSRLDRKIGRVIPHLFVHRLNSYDTHDHFS